MRKYCRICWNTRYWREPTGEAVSLETGQPTKFDSLGLKIPASFLLRADEIIE
jgi:hypothetical protein